MKKNRINLIITICLGVQILVVRFLSTKPQWVERYYSEGIYPYISNFLRLILGWIPFSVGDILLFVLIFICLRFLYRWIRDRFKNSLNRILQISSFISILYACFYLLWGLNYFRQPLSTRLGFKTSKYTTETLIETTQKIILKINDLQFNITQNDTVKVSVPYSQKTMYKKAILGYRNVSKKYPNLKYNNHSVKSSLMSLIQTYNGTSGYLNPFTGEAQVNYKIPKTSYPSTTCHEMSHQIGIAAENEANFVGFLTSIFNPDPYFKYSGYRMAFAHCISEVQKRDKQAYKKLWNKVNKGIKKDFVSSYDFWESYKNPIEPIVKKGYDSYLKANKQSKGIESYNYVVDLLISFFEHEQHP